MFKDEGQMASPGNKADRAVFLFFVFLLSNIPPLLSFPVACYKTGVSLGPLFLYTSPLVDDLTISTPRFMMSTKCFANLTRTVEGSAQRVFLVLGSGITKINWVIKG